MAQQTVTINRLGTRREWDGPNGKTIYLKLVFGDGSVGSVGVKPDKEEERVKALQGIIGTELSLELEDDGEYEGIKKWKIKGGLPWQNQAGGGGFKRDFIPRFQDTPEGWAENDERVDRRHAAELALQYMGVIHTSQRLPEGFERKLDMSSVAKEIYDWLRETAKKPGTTQQITQDAPKQVEPSPSTPVVESAPESAPTAKDVPQAAAVAFEEAKGVPGKGALQAAMVAACRVGRELGIEGVGDGLEWVKLAIKNIKAQEIEHPVWPSITSTWSADHWLTFGTALQQLEVPE
jgi:hypothetical protein